MARKKTGPPLKRGRKPTKPPKALKARTAYLSSLPAETLGLIASFLLPATTSLTLGFPSPHDRPYTSERTVTTMGKTERYGGIPGGIRDLTSFAQTCKNARRGVDLVVGRIGGIGKTGAIARPGMRTMYISLPAEADDDFPASMAQLSRTAQIRSSMLASRESLERLIIHECPHSSNDRVNNLTFTPLGPFQTDFPNQDDLAFPALTHLQLGPKLCLRCTQHYLRLLLGKKFRKDKRHEILDGVENTFTQWNFHSTATFNEAAGPRWDVFDTVAAPSLLALQLHLPEGGSRQTSKDVETFFDCTEGIDTSALKMFELWMNPNEGWGGLGVNGTSVFVKPKAIAAVEESLTSKALARQGKPKETPAEMLARYQAEAKEVIAKRKEAAVAKRNALLKKASDDQEEKSESSTPEQSVKDEPHDDVSEAATSGSTSDLLPYDRTERVRETSLGRTAAAYHGVLESIARSMPNLVGLAIHRKKFRPLLVDGGLGPETRRVTFAATLAGLQYLKHLDLELAICGVSELADFPLGLTMHKARSSGPKDPLMDLRREIYKETANAAVSDGDEWRRGVLEAMCRKPKAPDTEGDKAEAKATSETPEPVDVAWPEGITSGHVYTVDLLDRRKHNGMLVPWTMVEGKVELGKPEKIRL